MTVYGHRHLSNEDLKIAAQRLADERAAVVAAMRQQLYGRGDRSRKDRR
jgi:hypothetical protein